MSRMIAQFDRLGVASYLFSKAILCYELIFCALSMNEVAFEWIGGGCTELEHAIVWRFDLCRPLILSSYLEDYGSYIPERV